MYDYLTHETRLGKFDGSRHMIRIWENLGSGERHIEITDKEQGTTVLIETLDEVVEMIEMLVKAGVMLNESKTDC